MSILSDIEGLFHKDPVTPPVTTPAPTPVVATPAPHVAEVTIPTATPVVVQDKPVQPDGPVFLTAAFLHAVCPNAKADFVALILSNAGLFTTAGITTRLRLVHCFAQFGVETGGLTAIEENLKYTAGRLVQVWPHKFTSVTVATPYAGNPQKLANHVYAHVNGNGDEASGDGWKYRGSGFMQTTGRANFKATGHENDPDTLRTIPGALTSALKFWTDHKLNTYADKDDLLGLRKVVNGGTNGLSDCKLYLAHGKKFFTI